MSDPTSSYATAGIALSVPVALKPHHHDKVETPSMGRNISYRLKLQGYKLASTELVCFQMEYVVLKLKLVYQHGLC
jgi:hypothetical protein